MNMATWSGWLTSKLPSSAAAFIRPVAFGVVTTSSPPGATSACRPSRNEPGSSRCSITSPATTTSAGGEPEGRDRVDVAAVDDVRLVAARAGRRRRPRRRGRDRPAPTRVAARCSCSHAPDCSLSDLAAGVDEAHVHDPAARRRGRTGSRSGRRATPAGAGAPSRAARSRQSLMAVSVGPSRGSRRSASGGPARPRSMASILANVRRRLYQSSRLPDRPASGTTQNSSSGSKS